MITIWLNGVSEGTTTNSVTINDTDNQITIGKADVGYIAGGGNAFSAGNIYIDEVRISKGVARWTENFAVPQSPYSTVNDEFFTAQDSIVTINKLNWDTAYGWGDHSTAGYATSLS